MRPVTPRIFFEDNREALQSLPEQPNRAVRIVFSLILENIGFTEKVNAGLVECMSSETNTTQSTWGAYQMDRFTPSQIQVQYFSLVSEQESLDFPERLNRYIESGKLLWCFRDVNRGTSEDVMILSGRKVTAPRSGSIVSSAGSTPGWAIGVVFGVVASVGILALIVTVIKGEQIYPESEYEEFGKDMQKSGDPATPLSDAEANDSSIEDEDSEGAESELERELRTIAGQRDVCVTHKEN
ncbi:hypothetical protein BWQ96_01960 [Gracilariopsis chorda]|uniref:Uncharacterized protein n=1 Tax=Gracilariopsis chorda TaxID=448386 RepID=A0A2V3J1H5_9FLOR|nr:hypothetical protein BWQ96_01960 [Gracilariopsis chorda]|eukprot:PXF48271.1 hypothetical protein BWQ96_01960 [Gracilariopsis chorda]